MLRRIVTALIAVPLGILALVIDFVPLYIAIFAVFSVIAVYEMLLATKYIDNKLIAGVSLTFTAIVPLLFIVPGFRRNIIPLACLFIFALFIIMLVMHEKVRFEELALVFFISLCIPLSFSSLVFMRLIFEKDGIFFMVFTLVVAWMGDAGAYFIGTFLGRHKLAPKISPKKTWEGFIGGLVISGISGFVLAVCYEQVMRLTGNSVYFVEVNEWFLAGTAIICSGLGVVGDLSASVIKRQCAVKDFGNILPGHGGILDRFDSVLFVAPFVYQLFLFYNPIQAVIL